MHAPPPAAQPGTPPQAAPTAPPTAPTPPSAAPTAPPAAPGPPSARPLRKDQERALSAYAWANNAKTANALTDYEIAVQGFAAALLRTGFAAAVSVLERGANRPGAKLLLANLASRSLPGIPAADVAEWPNNVRALADIGRYMQATRELLASLAWLRRACRALGAGTEP